MPEIHIGAIHTDQRGKHWRVVGYDGGFHEGDIVVMACGLQYGTPRGPRITVKRETFISEYIYAATASI